MRKPERIDPIISTIERIWKMYPDLRLTQLILNARTEGRDPYNMEEDDLLEGLRRVYPKAFKAETCEWDEGAVTISVEPKRFSSDAKRFYAPIKISWGCPKCGRIEVHDVSQNYLSYPDFHAPSDVYLYCDDCDVGFEVEIEVGLTAKIVSEIREQ